MTFQKRISRGSEPMIIKHDLIIIDGGTGREIQRQGGPFRQPEWSALALYEDPSVVRRVHESYIASGSTYITTNSYAIVPFHIGTERYARDSKWLLKLAVDLALQAKGERSDINVLGSVPPICGSYEADKFDEVVGAPIVQDFLGAFRGRVDTVIFETQGSINEVSFYLKHFQDSQMGQMPVWISFCLKSTDNDKPILLSGETLTEATSFLVQSKMLASEGGPVSAILVNCCDVQIIGDAITELRLALPTSIRIGTYPNAFCSPPKNAANATLREINIDMTPEVLAQEALQWTKLGCSVVGGCCGIGPEHIQELCKLRQATN